MPTGEFEYLLLAVATSLGEDAYGASIRKRLIAYGHPRSVGAIQTGLDRLEKKGLIATRLGEPTAERGGRAKRMVRITSAGKKAAAEFYNMIHAASRGVQWMEDPR